MITLNNGAQALAFSGSQLGDGQWSGVVLAEFHGDYVTWAVLIDNNGNGECCWGRYYGADIDSARADFCQRAININSN